MNKIKSNLIKQSFY